MSVMNIILQSIVINRYQGHVRLVLSLLNGKSMLLNLNYLIVLISLLELRNSRMNRVCFK